MALISRACLQSIHEILGDLRTFSGVFDLVVGDLTNVSQYIVEYVGYLTLSWAPTHES